MPTFASTVVRFFLAGVATLLPLWVTIFVVTWVVRVADAYIGPSSGFGLFILKIVGDANKYSGYLAGYLVVVLLIMLLGFLVTRATIAKIHDAVDAMFARIPLFGRIYYAVGQMVEIFGRKENSGLDRFGGVGYVRMGNIRMLGFLTSAQGYTLDNGKKYCLVFIPNSPFPATGFNALVPTEDVVKLDMPVEEMAKLLMSFGLLGPQVLTRPYLSQNGKAPNDRETI
ncbi:MAG: DUF502 domain-containing protein [Desulfomonile tiedjei]|uniref:DUF502 domain-containing protein n=1 Tax=Desulfomonile tiedjei TaxID=2358 RepID=A0A9D6Z2M5_9BACT|nr:DUF502 domain-containing protein [Desulfomonile tiedjei]